jgi:hypothetical protein
MWNNVSFITTKFATKVQVNILTHMFCVRILCHKLCIYKKKLCFHIKNTCANVGWDKKEIPLKVERKNKNKVFTCLFVYQNQSMYNGWWKLKNLLLIFIYNTNYAMWQYVIGY